MHSGVEFEGFNTKETIWGPPWLWGKRALQSEQLGKTQNPKEVTQMVTSRTDHNPRKPARQGFRQTAPPPNKIGASTPFDFSAKNLTPYGGLLPVATML